MTFLGNTGPVPKRGKKSKNKDYETTNEVKAEKREDTLWKWFSLFIRLRDCADETRGFLKCCTCGKIVHYKKADCGHYISRRHKNTKYEETNNAGQCVHCNRDLYGNTDAYMGFIIKKYGRDELERLHGLKKQPAKKMKLWEVEAKIAEYRQKAKDEAHRLGIEIK